MGKKHKEKNTVPTKLRLAGVLRAAGLLNLATLAAAGRFDEFESDSPHPIVDLVEALKEVGRDDLARRAMKGDFDCTKAEADAWVRSQEGQAVINECFAEVDQPMPDTETMPDWIPPELIGKTMSRACPMCGATFEKKGVPVKTIVIRVAQNSFVGVSFDKACYDANPQRAHELVREAVAKGTAVTEHTETEAPVIN
jgi:hypothetical protein